jgi:hypothetical protein
MLYVQGYTPFDGAALPNTLGAAANPLSLLNLPRPKNYYYLFPRTSPHSIQVTLEFLLSSTRYLSLHAQIRT